MSSLLSALMLSIVIVTPDGNVPATTPQAVPAPQFVAPSAPTPAVAVVPPAVISGAPDIEAAGPNGALKGTYVAPESPNAPLVVIVPGSGPTDRDGNSRGVKAQTYKLLADGLVQQGIASIRIDKRGMFGSAAAYPRASEVTMTDYARDVLAWVDTARQKTGAPCAWLLGHSEGGLVALLAAQKGQNICGLVLVETPGRPVGDVVKDQLRASGADDYLIEEANNVVDSLAIGRPVNPYAVSPPVLQLFPPETQRFMMSILALKPSSLIANIKQPVLIIQGERDIQVSASDARQLKTAKPDAALVLLPNTNHVLKTVGSDDRATNLATYADGKAPLAPGVVDTIAQFIGAAR